MRSLAKPLAAGALCLAGWAAGPPALHVVGTDAGSWPAILGSVGIRGGGKAATGIFVVRGGDGTGASEWVERVEAGAYLILEGESEAARWFGIRPGAKRIRVAGIEDLLRPQMKLVWEQAVELPVYELPAEARVFARERWSGAPLVAGFRRGSGAVLWVALPPGERGYERFPSLIGALSELGLNPPFRSRRLWAFFDSSYRARVDLDYFAGRWRQAGIRALHVAAWHYHEADGARDEYLHRLIESCHRRGILVYAWLELPHVSERFWQDHPEWREKTALLQDAHLDWRKLMNLANEDCFRAAAQGVRSVLERFDWDGVNLAELYFESLQGAANPARFTPMNDDVRREFAKRAGFDPLEFFDPSSSSHGARNPAGLRRFLDFRAELSARIQARWLAELETARRSKGELDLVLTHVDDRLDVNMRDAIGTDAASMVPLVEKHGLTFLVEDPATVWHLGPERYDRIAAKYRALTPLRDRLGIDINIVERYQDVYPAKQQVGTELFQLVERAARAFPRVALYFESSVQAADIPWLASAAAAVDRYESAGRELVVSSPHGVGVPWRGNALVDGQPWPACDGETVWLPAGRHKLGPAAQGPAVRLLDFTGDMASLSVHDAGFTFVYRNQARAIAFVDKRPVRLEIDGSAAEVTLLEAANGFALRLPGGQHKAKLEFR